MHMVACGTDHTVGRTEEGAVWKSLIRPEGTGSLAARAIAYKTTWTVLGRERWLVEFLAA